MLTNGIIGMVVAVLGLLFMMHVCASETKEKFDRALAQEMEIDDHHV